MTGGMDRDGNRHSQPGETITGTPGGRVMLEWACQDFSPVLFLEPPVCQSASQLGSSQTEEEFGGGCNYNREGSIYTVLYFPTCHSDVLHAAMTVSFLILHSVCSAPFPSLKHTFIYPFDCH